MIIRTQLGKKFLSTTLAALFVATTVFSSVPAFAAEETPGEPVATEIPAPEAEAPVATETVSEAEVAEAIPVDTRTVIGIDPVSGDPIYEPVYNPEYFQQAAPAETGMYRSMRLMASSAQQIDPSDLSDWTVYTNYYDPSWNATTPGNWSTLYPKGSHPYYYWNESLGQSTTYYDLDTTAGINAMEASCFKTGAGASTVADFSKHIYTKGSTNNAEMVFLGNGTTAFVDFALAPVTDTRLKTVGFDIDAGAIDTHTMTSYGIMFNAGVDASGTLKAYALDFNNTNTGCKLVDISNGTNAASFHTGGLSTLAVGTSVMTFSRPASNKFRIDMDILPTSAVLTFTPYDTAGNLEPAKAQNATIPGLNNTGFSGFGPYVNYCGHGCQSLTHIHFGNMQMSVNYKVIFDKNAADAVMTSPDTVTEIEPGASIGQTPGASMPANPTRSGYAFMGWNTNADGSGTPFDANTPVNKITTVYAVWKADCKMNYVAGANGSISGNAQEIVPVYASPKNVPTPVPNANYNFQYWLGDDGTHYTAAQIMALVPMRDMTFTAIFDLVPVPVRYVAGTNGTLTGGTPSSSVPYGSSLPTAPTPVPNKGYVFYEWRNSAGTVIDPATAKADYNCDPITASFEIDQNGDGTADKDQKKFQVKLDTIGPGAFAATDLTSYSVIEWVHTGSAALSTAIGGFKVPQLIPNKTVDPTARFWWWEDEAGAQITTTPSAIGNYNVSKDCTVYAFFDTDKDGDGTPDSKQTKYVVDAKVRGNGTITGQTLFDVYQNSTNTQTLGNAIGGFTAPKTVPANANTVFYRWEDAAGNEIKNPANYGVKNSQTIYARFEDDEDGDGIADIDQNVYVVTFAADSNGRITSGKTSFKFIGGKKGDNIPLTAKDVVGSSYAVPSVTGKNAEFLFKSWTSTPTGKDPSNLSLTSNVDFVADFNAKTYTITYIVNGTTIKTVANVLAKGDKIGTNAPTAAEISAKLGAGCTFANWQAPDGSLYNMTAIGGATVTGDMVFVAKYTQAKIVSKR